MPDAELELTLYSSRIAGLYESSRMLWIYVTIGGLITVIISLIGLIGYTNDEINRRRKEIAIRKINGASVRTILRIFLGDILRITPPGSPAGLRHFLLRFGILATAICRESSAEPFVFYRGRPERLHHRHRLRGLPHLESSQRESGQQPEIGINQITYPGLFLLFLSGA